MIKLILVFFILLNYQNIAISGTKVGIAEDIMMKIKNSNANARMIKDIDSKGNSMANSAEISTRIEFTDFQKNVEEAIFLYAKENPKSKITLAIHTPTPPTPLRLTQNAENIQSIASTTNADILQNLKERQQVLNNLLGMRNVKVLAIYYKNNKETPGYDAYMELVKKHKNLLDIADSNYEKDLRSGATYIITNSNKKDSFVFDISADQVNKNDNLAAWKIYLGEYNNTPSEVQNKVDAISKIIS